VKLLLDENLSPRLVDTLSDLYPGSAHVHDLGLGAADDREIWDHASLHRFAIVSKDADFAERSVLENHPPKIIWLKLGNCSTDEVNKLLRGHSVIIQEFLEQDEETCLVLERGRAPAMPR
jgi:predicted nuclease of predicted toxin-antitoxin system